MMSKKYAIGVDFGTQSGRTVVADVENGDMVSTAVLEYPHGVMDEQLPDGTRLPADYALQHPQDYIDVLTETIPQALKKAGINKEDVIGMSVDFTACTMLPVDADGKPLCFQKRYAGNPHAYVKLWKHHAAQKQANRLNKIAKERGETFLSRYGGKISSEWMFPKIMQILEEDEALYQDADRFLEAADFISLTLTGLERRNSCTAGYKALWSKREGYPNESFFTALNPGLTHVVDEKLSRDIYPIGSLCGGLTEEMAQKIGLNAGTAVAVSNVDAHVAVPAVGIVSEGKMLMIMGTSTCHMVLSKEEKIVPGMCGYTEDGIIPGFLGYEAGQSCCGDHFAWLIDNCVPERYQQEAREKGVSIHQVLREKAQALKPGESGLLALDWWNGNRSVLVDVDLTGMILGMTLLTKPEEIYRALIEATAYGTNKIIETFEENGIAVDELYACGGIAEKDDFMMQIYADVCNREIRISASEQTVALGSAMFGAVAAGSKNGGYDSIFDAAKYMAKIREKVFYPIPEHVAVYQKLYEEYKMLHDYFGCGGNDVMKRLKTLKESQTAKKAGV